MWNLMSHDGIADLAFGVIEIADLAVLTEIADLASVHTEIADLASFSLKGHTISEADKPLTQLQLCDVHKLFHSDFSTCILGAALSQPPQLHQVCTTRSPNHKNFQACQPWYISSNKKKVDTTCGAYDPLLDIKDPTGSSAAQRGQKPPRASYGKCAALCPWLDLGTSCKWLLPKELHNASLSAAEELLSKQVCRNVQVVEPGSEKKEKLVKACM
eukprot:gene2419-2724_t